MKIDNEKLKRNIKMRGLTIRQIANYLELNESSLYGNLNGYNKMNIKTVKKIVEIINEHNIENVHEKVSVADFVDVGGK